MSCCIIVVPLSHHLISQSHHYQPVFHPFSVGHVIVCNILLVHSRSLSSPYGFFTAMPSYTIIGLVPCSNACYCTVDKLYTIMMDAKIVIGIDEGECVQMVPVYTVK